MADGPPFPDHPQESRIVSAILAQDRYGRGRAPRRGRVALIAAGALGLLAALVWISWVALVNQPEVTWQDIGFDVRSDARTTVTFDVSFSDRPGGARPTATCTVQALNTLRTEVGLQDVRVQAGPKGRTRVEVSLPTSERATTGLVKSCVLN
jgi:hypothetical protein